MNRRISLAIAALVVATASIPVRADGVRYTITDLGSLYGCCSPDAESGAAGINNAGEVVGFTLVHGDPDRPVPFIYRNGVMSAITTHYGYATAINAAGHVTGFMQRPGRDNVEAFLYRDGAVQNLGGLPRHSRDGYAVGQALNNTGMIVGLAGGFASGDAAMLYVDHHMYSSNYRRATVAYGVNDAGAIVGMMADVGTLVHAFLVNAQGFRDLGTLDGDPAGVSIAYAINASGRVAGTSWIAGNSTQRAFLYDNGVMRDIGTLAGGYAGAFAINAAGAIVGESDGTAFLYEGGVMQDLNALVAHDENDLWPRVHTATGINDLGQIVGTAYFGDRPGLHAFLMTPQP